MDPLIEGFIEKILEEAQLTSLPEDFKAQLKLRLGEEILRRVGILTMNALKDEDLQELDRILTAHEEPDPVKMVEFFKTKIPNYDQFIAGKLVELKDEFVNKAKSMQA